MQDLNFARLFRSSAPSPLQWSSRWARLLYLTGFSGLMGAWLALAAIAQVAPTLKPEEQNAGRYLSAISRAQREHYARYGRFAPDWQALDPKLVPRDSAYKYGLQPGTQSMTIFAEPLRPDLKGAMAQLMFNSQTQQLDGKLCITEKSGQSSNAATKSFLDPVRSCEFQSIRR
jgi:hypothetical protein